MRTEDPQLRSERAGALTRVEFTARETAFRFSKGKSGNPDGQSRFYHQCRKIAREASLEMMRGLVELAKTAEDERVRSVCLIAVLDRAGVKPIDLDPKAEEGDRRPKFDPSLYFHEELLQLYAVLEMMARRQGLLPPSAGEDVAG
jgi:hypothetical protein